ncbi:uncharacterized protein LOC143265906 [Megachile rotundata]|uniref:uncharacterized protein LOC143265906 n=1 Tax=Megachile rotundata TaxID=143995 RepID=UPI003FD6073F
MVERFHRQLKAAIKCHGDERWTDVLPIVLLGIRSAFRPDLKASAAELVYGETLCLPAEFFKNSERTNTDPIELVDQLHTQFRKLRPVSGSRHGEKKVFLFKDLDTASHVFVRVDATKGSLQQPYEGPFPVISRSEKTFIIRIKDKDTTVSIDRLKPAYIFEPDDTTSDINEQTPVYFMRQSTMRDQPAGTDEPYQTRSGRRVRFPDRLEVGR